MRDDKLLHDLHTLNHVLKNLNEDYAASLIMKSITRIHELKIENKEIRRESLAISALDFVMPPVSHAAFKVIYKTMRNAKNHKEALKYLIKIIKKTV